MKKLILASASPRRRDLLTSLGLSFEVYATDADESVPEGTPPEKLVGMLAERKAKAAAALFPDDVVIAADTVVSIGNRVLGKPRGDDEAREMLRALSGKRHTVYTGVAVISGGDLFSETLGCGVFMRKIEERELEAYVRTGEPRDKAGAYGIQGLGGIFVTGIEGDYWCVTGMPKEATARLLSLAGIDVLFNDGEIS